jgi:hypothetical protein
MKRTWTHRLTLASQAVVCVALGVAVLSGRHPPAHAQQPSPVREAEIRADQRRDDNLETLAGGVKANQASIQRQWDAINALRGDIAKVAQAQQQQQTTDAGDKGGASKLLITALVGNITTIGLQVAGRRRRKSRDDDDDEEDDKPKSKE